MKKTLTISLALVLSLSPMMQAIGETIPNEKDDPHYIVNYKCHHLTYQVKNKGDYQSAILKAADYWIKLNDLAYGSDNTSSKLDKTNPNDYPQKVYNYCLKNQDDLLMNAATKFFENEI